MSPFRWKTAQLYFDDVVILSKKVMHHMALVGKVLSLLAAADQTLKLRKWAFYAEVTNYLGHVIHRGRLKIAEPTIKAVNNYRTNKTSSSPVFSGIV